MTEKLKSLMVAFKEIPHDLYAIGMLLAGTTLALFGHKDEGQLLIGGGLSVFKGQQ